jgi:hypothetical protein
MIFFSPLQENARIVHREDHDHFQIISIILPFEVIQSRSLVAKVGCTGGGGAGGEPLRARRSFIYD